MNIDFLRKFEARNTQTESLMAAEVELNLLADGFMRRSLDIPKWVATKLDEIRTQIDVNVRAERMAELREVESRIEERKTPSQKNADDTKRAALLRSLLGEKATK